MKYLVLHHTAVKSSTKQIWAVDRYHKNKWNMKSSLGWYVGYNYFIETDAKRYLTRAIGEETMAAVGHNCNVPSKCDSIHVSIAGDFNNDFINTKQNEEFIKLITHIREEFPDIEIVGHRDVQENRTCPGYYVTEDDIKDWNIKPDIEDAEKARQIAQMQTLLDKLRTLLAQLKLLTLGR